MECDTLKSQIDTDMLDELLDALDMVMPDAEVLPSMSSFQDVIQATFQWTHAEASGNMNIMFPTWVSHELRQPNNPAQASPFQQQQQQLQQAVPNNSSCSLFTFTTGMQPTNICYDIGTAAPAGAAGAGAGAAPKASPFAGLHISSIVQQPAAVPLAAKMQTQLDAALISPDATAAVSSLPAAGTPAAAAASKQQTSPAADCSSDCTPYIEQHHHQQQQQQQGQGDPQQQQRVRGKRGRPQKVDGKYSKGYTSILKYRQRKKDMVQQMEQEVAEKLAQLKQLQEQQQQLLNTATMLEQSMGAQEALLTQMAELRLSVGPEQPDSSATVNVLTQPQQQQQQQQIDGVTVSDALPEMLQRYQQYIKDATAALAVKCTSQQQQQQTGGSSSNSCTDKHRSSSSSSSFPQFPFSIVDTLALWRVSRVAGVPATSPPAANSSSSSSATTAAAAAATAAAAGQGSCEGASDVRTLNLNTWLHDAVSADKWKQIAQQLNIQPQQKQQLAAAWQLYVSAVQKLNKERQQLVQQLQLLLQTGSSDVPTAAAAPQESPDGPAAAAAAAMAGCICTPLSGAEYQGYVDVAAAIEWNLVRGRAMVMLFGWSMLCVLDSEQVGILCVGAWPHFPLVRAVVAHVLAEERPSSCP